MQILLRVTEQYGDQEFGLEEKFHPLMIDSAKSDILMLAYQTMKKVIDDDIERHKRKNPLWP